MKLFSRTSSSLVQRVDIPGDIFGWILKEACARKFLVYKSDKTKDPTDNRAPWLPNVKDRIYQTSKHINKSQQRDEVPFTFILDAACVEKYDNGVSNEPNHTANYQESKIAETDVWKLAEQNIFCFIIHVALLMGTWPCKSLFDKNLHVYNFLLL